MLTPTDRIEMLSNRTSNLLELATQKFGALTNAEEKLFRAAANGKLADYSADSEKDNDPATAENWGNERLLNANRIAWLCTDPQASVLVMHRGIWIKGARIDGELELQFAKISFPLDFEKIAFSEKINLMDAKQLVTIDDGLTKHHPNYLTVTADQSSATWNSVAAHEIATVTGMVRMRILPEITSNLGNDSNTAMLSLGSASDPDGFIAATTATQLDADEIWWSSTGSDNKKFVSKSNIVDFVVNSEDVGYTVGTTATTAGSITFHIWWEPLDSTGAVAAGAGGTFA